ncbi:MAG: PAS domain-containing sensor histidine kinase, partial [Betaproteobacteria bacterium]|nr:PAS domain-containing sensor histidine kinase [Betaproteobacteria bacterium]
VSNCLGQSIDSLPGIAPLASQIREAFNESSRRGADHWQRQFVIGQHPGDPAPQDPSGPGDAPEASLAGSVTTPQGRTLLANGTTLPGAASPLPGADGLLIVFDDVSEVVSAQRTLAWNEVARRLAHEIKNPLTPIQLTAERLPRKLAGKLDAADAEFLRRGATTIVNQVEALARMVDDFRSYARLPAAQLIPLDLNELVREVLLLYGGQETEGELETGAGVLVRARLAELPRVMGDASQLRQVLHNLIKNAQEAMASGAGRRIDMSTAVIRAGTAGVTAGVRLRVRDEGPGFAPGVVARAFEPYVTAKPRGTGLGLAIVRKIVDEHGARIALENRLDADGVICGAQVEITFTRIVV